MGDGQLLLPVLALRCPRSITSKVLAGEINWDVPQMATAEPTSGQGGGERKGEGGGRLSCGCGQTTAAHNVAIIPRPSTCSCQGSVSRVRGSRGSDRRRWAGRTAGMTHPSTHPGWEAAACCCRRGQATVTHRRVNIRPPELNS